MFDGRQTMQPRLFHSQPAFIKPMQHGYTQPHQLPAHFNFPLQMQQQFHQHAPLPFGAHRTGPQIHLSQRQIELLSLRNGLNQQNQTQKMHSTSERPILLTKSNLSDKTISEAKKDPPMKPQTKTNVRRDPPTAASVVMSTVENEHSRRDSFAARDQNEPESIQTNNSEQQRKFLRNILQKAGSHSIATTSTSSNKASKDLVKKMLQKSASSLTSSRVKHTIGKSSSGIGKKLTGNQDKDSRANDSSTSSRMRERWFKRKGVMATLANSTTISASMSSSSSSWTQDQLSPKETIDSSDESLSEIGGVSVDDDVSKINAIPLNDLENHVAKKSEKKSGNTSEHSTVKIAKNLTEENVASTRRRVDAKSADKKTLEVLRTSPKLKEHQNSRILTEKNQTTNHEETSKVLQKQSSSPKMPPSISDEDFDSDYAAFVNSLQQEVFSGHFTQLWSSFSSLLLDKVELESATSNPMTNSVPYKVADPTKKIIKELNHHVKKYGNVECMVRSQLVSDKQFLQSIQGNRISNKTGRDKLAQGTDGDDLPALESVASSTSADTKSIIPSSYQLETKSGSVSLGSSISSFKSADAGHGPEVDRRQLRSKSILRVNTLSAKHDHSQQSISAAISNDMPRSKQEVRANKDNKAISPTDSLGIGSVHSQTVTSTSSSKSLSSFPWVERRDLLRPVAEVVNITSRRHDVHQDPSNTAQLSPIWANITLRTEANSPKIAQSPHKGNTEPEWAKITLRPVDKGSRFGQKTTNKRSNNAVHAVSDSSYSSIDEKESLPPTSRQRTDETAQINGSRSEEIIDTASSNSRSKIDSIERTKENIKDKVLPTVIIRLRSSTQDFGSLVESTEARIILGKTMLMKVHSQSGASQAVVQWKLTKTEVESLTLDTAKKQVTLILGPGFRSEKSFVLDFENEEDCLRFASCFYQMPTEFDQDHLSLADSDYTDSTATALLENNRELTEHLPEKGNASITVESLNNEEQNVLETYRRLRQTQEADEALTGSISKKPQGAVEPLRLGDSRMLELGLENGCTSIPEVPLTVNGVLESMRPSMMRSLIAPPQYVLPPDLPSSPISTFSNSVCTNSSSIEGMKFVEKYRSILHNNNAMGTAQKPINIDNVDPSVSINVLHNLESHSMAEEDLKLSIDDKQKVAMYRKMLSLGLPEEAVRHKMKQDQCKNEIIIGAVFKNTDNPGDSKTMLTADEAVIADKYRKLLSMGIPGVAVQHKMKTDKVEQKIIEAVFGKVNATSEEVNFEQKDCFESRTLRSKLSDEEESIASNYRKLLKLQIPKDAVLSRMEKEGVSKNIIASVIGVKNLASSKAQQMQKEKDGTLSSAASTGSNLISFHWNVLSGQAIPGSVWDKVNVSGAHESDVSELIELFQKKSTLKSARSVDNSFDDGSSFGNSKARLLDLTRSNNIAISLKAFKEFSHSDLAEIIAFVDPHRKLRGERSQFVRDLVPTAPEIKTIESYTGSEDRLAPAERWFRQLVGIKRIESKAQIIRTMELFSSELEIVQSNFNLLSVVCNQVMKSERLTILLQAVLLIGNKLNEGTRNGAAAGFRFDSLLRLTQTKASDGKTTALDYLVKEFGEKGQRDTLILIEDFPECQTASRMLISDMTTEVDNLQATLTQCKVELQFMKNEDCIHQSNQNSSSKGISRLSTFIESAEVLLKILTRDRDSALQACKDLAKYSGEGGGVGSTTTILGILSEFASNINVAVKKYDEQQRTAARKQKAQETKEIKSALKVIETSSHTNAKGKSLVLLVNDILRNANPQFKEDFKKGRVLPNPSNALKTVYELEQKRKTELLQLNSATADIPPKVSLSKLSDSSSQSLPLNSEERINQNDTSKDRHDSSETTQNNDTTTATDNQFGNSDQTLPNDQVGNSNKHITITSEFDSSLGAMIANENTANECADVEDAESKASLSSLAAAQVIQSSDIVENGPDPDEQDTKSVQSIKCSIVAMATDPVSCKSNNLIEAKSGVDFVATKSNFVMNSSIGAITDPECVYPSLTTSNSDVSDDTRSQISPRIEENPPASKNQSKKTQENTITTAQKNSLDSVNLNTTQNTGSAEKTEKPPRIDLSSSEQRLLARQSVSGVVKSLQRYSLSKKEKAGESSLGSPQKSNMRTLSMSAASHEKSSKQRSETDQRKESQVARLARLKREEKTRSSSEKDFSQGKQEKMSKSRLSAPVPQNGVSSKTSIGTTTLTSMESSTARMAREKRANKRMSR